MRRFRRLSARNLLRAQASKQTPDQPEKSAGQCGRNDHADEPRKVSRFERLAPGTDSPGRAEPTARAGASAGTVRLKPDTTYDESESDAGPAEAGHYVGTGLG